MPCDVRGYGMSAEETLKSLLQMYADAVKLLTKDQIELANNSGIEFKENPMYIGNPELCALCKFLDSEQMKKVIETGGLSTHVDLYGWYCSHLWNDIHYNNDALEQDIAISELKRIDKYFTTSCSKCGIEIDPRIGDIGRNHLEGCIYKC